MAAGFRGTAERLSLLPADMQTMGLNLHMADGNDRTLLLLPAMAEGDKDQVRALLMFFFESTQVLDN